MVNLNSDWFGQDGLNGQYSIAVQATGDDSNYSSSSVVSIYSVDASRQQDFMKDAKVLTPSIDLSKFNLLAGTNRIQVSEADSTLNYGSSVNFIASPNITVSSTQGVSLAAPSSETLNGLT